MGKNINVKSTARQPLRMLLLFGLLGLISFAFVSRAVEYLIVQRETDRLGTYYRAIGSLEPLDSNNYMIDVSEAADLISQSSYVAYADIRQIATGELTSIYNADVEGALNVYLGEPYSKRIGNTDILVYGEVTSKNDVSDSGGYFTISFMVDRVVTGYPEYVAENQSVQVFFGGESGVFDAMEEGHRYFFRAMYDYAGFGQGDWRNARYRMTLIPLYEDGPWFLEAAPGEEVNLDDPDLARLKQEVAFLQVNQHAVAVFGTSDMSAMQTVQESAQYYYLSEGRWLNHEDEVAGNSVCVVHQDFAEMRDLSLGDEITVTLRPIKLYFDGYITGEEDWENWQSYPTHELTCQIVGLYGLTLDGSMYNTKIFIPNSSLPTEFAYQDEAGLYFTNFSFVLNSTQDQDAFLLEYQEIVTEQGLMIRFEENNSQAFWAAVVPLEQGVRINVAVFGGVLIVALLLVVFIYLLQRRRDFAILRALGVPRGKAIRQMLLPITLIGMAGIFGGGWASWRYALGKAEETLSALPTPAGVELSVMLNELWLVGLCGAILVLLMIIVLIGALIIAHRPVLELLQGRSTRKRR